MARGITAHAHLQPMGDPMELMPLEAVLPGQHCTRKTSWAGRLLIHASDVGHTAHLEVHVGDAVADGGRGGRVALAHLLRQLHMAHLHRVPRVILRQALRSVFDVVSVVQEAKLRKGQPIPMYALSQRAFCKTP